MNFDLTAPEFSDPLPIDLFLESGDNAYLYDDLRQFEHYFLDYLTDTDHHFDRPLGLWASSSDELIFLVAACWRLGLSFIPFDPELSEAAFSKQVQQIAVETIITDQINSISNSSINTIPIDQFDLNKIIKPNFEPQEWVKKQRKSTQADQYFGYFFTSGTSGPPKIVPLKRRQMLFAAKASAHNLKPLRNHFWLLCMPLHHVGGISLIIRSLLYGSAIFRMDSFNRQKITNYLSKDHRFQAASFVPTMLKRLLSRPDFQIHEQFQAILLGGGPINEVLVEECFERGVPLIASYGMTESCAQIAANPLMTIGDLSRPKKSVGKVFPPNKIEIRNNNSQPVAAGTSGEVWLKGPQVFDGYLHHSSDQNFDKNRWFQTGDYGHLNNNDELFIEARRTDIIISGGENVSPSEVEEALQELDTIQGAAVIGLPDDEWGQKVVAVVVLEDGSTLNTQELQKQLRTKIRAFKIPKQIIAVNIIPRTTTGKIKRNKIKEEFYE